MVAEVTTRLQFAATAEMQWELCTLHGVTPWGKQCWQHGGLPPGSGHGWILGGICPHSHPAGSRAVLGAGGGGTETCTMRELHTPAAHGAAWQDRLPVSPRAFVCLDVAAAHGPGSTPSSGAHSTTQQHPTWPTGGKHLSSPIHTCSGSEVHCTVAGRISPLLGC